jgi:hypothetical protein
MAYAKCNVCADYCGSAWLCPSITENITHGGEFLLVGYNAYGPLKVSRRFRGTCLHFQSRRISQARNQLVIDHRQETSSSETSVDFQRTTRRYF